MKTLITKIQTLITNFSLLLIVIMAFPISIFQVVYSQGEEIHKEAGVMGIFLPSANTIQTQSAFEYTPELFPDQIFQGWIYYWTTGVPLSANFQENPDVPWLSISPTTFTSNSCNDIIPVAYNLVAPTTPGIYTTTIEDLNGNWDDTNVTLTVTNSPTPTDSVFVQISNGQTITLFDTVTWNGFGNFSCVDNYIPDSSTTYIYSINPLVSWLTIQPSNFTIFFNDTIIAEKIFTSDTLDNLSTYEILERTWFSFPQYIYFTLENVTAIEDQSNGNLPGSIELFQNYPNPFNPSTTISYTISTPGFVSLKVYDMLGKEIKVLVNEFQSVGGYSIDFDAGEFSSGIYLYQLKAGNVVKTNKMLLLK